MRLSLYKMIVIQLKRKNQQIGLLLVTKNKIAVFQKVITKQ